MNWLFATAMAERGSSFTKLEKRIAAYLTANPEAVLVETSAAIASRAGVSPMTVTRFFKKLGFENAAAVKSEAKRQVYGASASGIGTRFEEFRRSRDPAKSDDWFEGAATALRKACDCRHKPIWSEIVRHVAYADSVFAAGFQTMSYLANGLVLRLGYVRPNVHELDGGDGVYAKVLADPAPRRTLIIIDMFRYGRNGPVLAQAARDRGAEVIVFCDEFCDWAADITPYVLALPSESGFFFRPTTAIHFSLALLVQDVIDELGDQVRGQIALMSQAQEWFGQYAK